VDHASDDECAKYLPGYEVAVDGAPVSVDDLQDGDVFAEAVYPGTLWRVDGVHHDGDDEVHLEIVEVTDVEQAAVITISLVIENRYEGDVMILTWIADAVIPAPPDSDDADATDEWEYDHIFSFTGTDRQDGDSWYDVTVMACSDPALVGKTYAFGY
jgi:hypothetical protein